MRRYLQLPKDSIDSSIDGFRCATRRRVYARFLSRLPLVTSGLLPLPLPLPLPVPAHVLFLFSCDRTPRAMFCFCSHAVVPPGATQNDSPSQGRVHAHQALLSVPPQVRERGAAIPEEDWHVSYSCREGGREGGRGGGDRERERASWRPEESLRERGVNV